MSDLSQVNPSTDGGAETTSTPARSESSGIVQGQGVHQLGYRSWSGVLAPAWTRWSVISDVGVRRSWQNLWLKRLLTFAWVPALWFGIGFFLWEQAAQYSEWQQLVTPMLRSLPPTPVFDEVRHSFETGNLADSRHTVWAWLLQSFFRYPQAVLMVLIVGLVAPPLISQDIRSRAFLLYFSRPLTRSEYLLGKLGTLWAYLGLITAAPALILYLMGVVLSPSLNVIAATWDLPIRIVGATIVLMLPTSALALCLSSMTQESRYAGFSWFAIWILGWFTYGAAQSAEAFNTAQQNGFQQQDNFRNPGRDRFRGPPGFRQRPVVEMKESVWTHLSLYHTLGRVQSWVFGFSKFSEIMASMAILIGLTAVSLAILFYRISAPMRV